jgi:protein transport protein SEC13
VNALAWAPHEYGAVLACASSDGTFSTITYDAASAQWVVEKVAHAHAIGCTGVSWAPAAMPGSLVSAGGGGGGDQAAVGPQRLCTSGCDNTVKVWRRDAGQWTCEATLSAHGDWVRDVAWSENMGLPMNTIASCGQDGKVFIWTQGAPGGAWASRELHDFGAPVWRVSWSTMGNILAVSDGNNTVSIWKESIDGVWNQISAAAE